jgi:methylthioribose-1-phosphate isomerase
MLPTIEWRQNRVIMIDQRKLPGQEVYVSCRSYIQVAQAIERLVIRGAPAIGVAAAYGVALGMLALRDRRRPEAEFEKVYARLERTRPTAVNLFWALRRLRAVFEKTRRRGTTIMQGALLAEARAIEAEDAEVCREIGQHGQSVLKTGWTVLTHCNAGALATAAYGTALGVIRAAVEKGKKIRVYADETRPVLQGARLTVWELERSGIPVVLITDDMAGWLMRKGEIQAAVVGADRVARNGDTANKIGTYTVAVLAKENKIPFYVAAPRSTIDKGLRDGNRIPIEERAAREVREVGGHLVTLPYVEVRNPAFDVTPAKYITGIITERGIARPPYERTLRALLK